MATYNVNRICPNCFELEENCICEEEDLDNKEFDWNDFEKDYEFTDLDI